MKNLNRHTLIVSCLMAGLGSIAMAENEKASAIVESAETSLYDMLDKNTLTVDFDANSAVVSESQKSTLRATVNAFRKDAKIERVIVAAWSDSNLPKDDKVKLSDAEKKLANERASNLRSALKEMGVTNVDTHSMAEHANWVQKLFKTDDAQIKKSMKGKAVDATEDKALAEKLADKGGPGKAAIIIVSENSYLSH